ncbi:MAG: hypothetical protein JWN28_399 [Candidatus Saccharibacteria bacterium]|nr:hypothetical protein [Candidatus Saccharibacteria bacterium]
MFEIFDGWALVLWTLGGIMIVCGIICFFIADGGMLLVIFGIVAIIWGGGIQTGHDANKFEVKSAGEACVLESAREVPAGATLGTAKDDRVGPIYPCYFLLDQGIQPGIDGVFDPVPMKMFGEVNESLFADQNFTAEGNLGGVALLGTGVISGDYKASETTERTQVVAFMAETSGGYASFVVETGSVRYKECADCIPNVRIWTSKEPMFTKTLGEEKDDSIWLTTEDAPPVASLTRDNAPVSPGRTVQALATRIVIELPSSLMPGANPLPIN